MNAFRHSCFGTAGHFAADGIMGIAGIDGIQRKGSHMGKPCGIPLQLFEVFPLMYGPASFFFRTTCRMRSLDLMRLVLPLSFRSLRSSLVHEAFALHGLRTCAPAPFSQTSKLSSMSWASEGMRSTFWPVTSRLAEQEATRGSWHRY